MRDRLASRSTARRSQARQRRVDRLTHGPRLIGRSLRRVGLTVVGLVVVGVGVLLIPLPGPGWAIVFAGLGILSSQWPWLRRPIRAAQRLALDTPPLLLGLAVIGGGFLVLNFPVEVPQQRNVAITTIVFGALVIPFQLPALRRFGRRVLRRARTRTASTLNGDAGNGAGER